MKITDQMLVPDDSDHDDAIIRKCTTCGCRSWHVPQKVMVLSRSGARRMRLWTCEEHPLPDTVTDDPDED